MLLLKALYMLCVLCSKAYLLYLRYICFEGSSRALFKANKGTAVGEGAADVVVTTEEDGTIGGLSTTEDECTAVSAGATGGEVAGGGMTGVVDDGLTVSV